MYTLTFSLYSLYDATTMSIKTKKLVVYYLPNSRVKYVG